MMKSGSSHTFWEMVYVFAPDCFRIAWCWPLFAFKRNNNFSSFHIAQFLNNIGYVIYVSTGNVGATKNKKPRHFRIESSVVEEVANIPAGTTPLVVGMNLPYPSLQKDLLSYSQIVMALAKGLILPYMLPHRMHPGHFFFHNYKISRIIKVTFFCFVDLPKMKDGSFVFNPDITKTADADADFMIGLEVYQNFYYIYMRDTETENRWEFNTNIKYQNGVTFEKLFFSLRNQSMYDLEHKFFASLFSLLPLSNCVFERE
jgi:hypothetical protein